MKYDAQVKIIKSSKPDVLAVGAEIVIPIDYDNVSDFNDVIRDVSYEIYNRYDMIMSYMVDYEITNAMDICSDIFES
jgi:hypothetical protein